MRWPRTVVAGANRNAFRVEHLTQVMRVDTVDSKRDRATAILSRQRASNAQPINCLHLLQRIGRELVFVSLDLLHTHLGEETHCLAEPHDLRGHLGSRLEALRCGSKGGFLHAHDLDHGTTRQERRQLGEVLGVHRAHTTGAAHLVPGEGSEVNVQGVEIDRHVRHGLASVEHGESPDSLCAAHHLLDICNRTGDV